MRRSRPPHAPPRPFSPLRQRGNIVMARFSYAVGAVVLLGFLASPVLPMSMVTMGLWVSVVAGFAWLGILCLQLHGSVTAGAEPNAPTERPSAGR